MMILSSRSLALLGMVFVVAGCAGGAPAVKAAPAAGDAPAPPAVEGACAGAIDPAPAGAEAVDDAALLREALGAPGQGKLCAGRVFEAKRPLKVYRVWHQERAYTEIGRWWSLSMPRGPRDAYRQANAICLEWSALDVLSACEIKAGARFVIGPGQSARCDGAAEYGRSPVNQVYLSNDTRVGRVFVDNCERLGAWP